MTKKQKRKRKKWKLRRVRSALRWNRLWVVMAAATLGLSLVAVIVITQVVYYHANNAINQSIIQNNSQIARNVGSSIDSYINEMVSISNNVTALLNQVPPEELSQRLFVFLREDIETIAVFDEQGRIVLNTDPRPLREDIRLTRQSWFTRVSASDAGYLISAPHVQRLYRGSYPWVITLTRGVSWTQGGTTHHGIIMVDMNFTRIQSLCSRVLENDGYLYITDVQGNVVYHPKQQMIYAGILPEDVTLTVGGNEGNTVVESSGGKLTASVQTLGETPWKVIGVASLNGLAAYDSGTDAFVATAIVSLALAVLIGSLLISRLILRPLHRLMALMEDSSDVEKMPRAPEGGLYEVGQLGKSLNGMVDRIRQLMLQVREEQQLLHRSELKTLNAQINPHFLYNTLDSVIWLAESGDEKGVIQMVMALSKYFRLSLSGAKDFIPVADELQQVENYLIIQKMRFGESFTYQIFCEDAVREITIPKILLQPIVENALVHGISTMGEGGCIQIIARRCSDMLLMEVRDNGCGIKPEVLAHILEANTHSGSGIGLKNVHQRIQLTCGTKYGLEVLSELDEGTTVFVYLPLETDSEKRGAKE